MTRGLLISLVLGFCFTAVAFGQEREVASSSSTSGLSGVPNGINIKRTYPGGRDDSDLTVQPVKRITKKESNAERGETEEDFDQGDASGFGE